MCGPIISWPAPSAFWWTHTFTLLRMQRTSAFRVKDMMYEWKTEGASKILLVDDDDVGIEDEDEDEDDDISIYLYLSQIKL
jgi:hypothetical protein